MFLMNLSFFSVSKAKLSEYSEKIEALAARLAASAVCYYLRQYHSYFIC
jgi:hypothetical protein